MSRKLGRRVKKDLIRPMKETGTHAISDDVRAPNSISRGINETPITRYIFLPTGYRRWNFETVVLFVQSFNDAAAIPANLETNRVPM